MYTLCNSVVYRRDEHVLMSYKVRVDIKQWEPLWSKSFCTSEFPTSVGCSHEIATNCLKILAQLAKNFHENVLMYMYVCM